MGFTIQDQVILSAIAAEAAARQSAFDSLQNQINGLGTNVASYSAVLSQIGQFVDANGTFNASAIVGKIGLTQIQPGFALASDYQILAAQVTGNQATNTAQITTLQQTIATETSALAQSTTQLTATVQNNQIQANASIIQQAIVSASATAAVASTVTTLTATVASNLATVTSSITTEATTRSTADTALATLITTLTATVNTNNTTLTAAVTTEASARATADGYLSANYSLTVTAGNQVTGMQFNSSVGGGSTSSTISFQASVFTIWNGSSAIAPFTVSGGIVTIGSELDVGSSWSRTQITSTGAKFGGNTISITGAGGYGQILVGDTTNGVGMSGGSGIGAFACIHGGALTAVYSYTGDASVQNLYVSTTTPGTPSTTSAGFWASNDGQFCAVTNSGATSTFVKLDADGAVINFSRDGSTVVGSVSITTTATSYNTTSDARMKRDFKPWTLGAAIDDIRIGEFKWASSNLPGHGVLAQSLYKVFPDAVTPGTGSFPWAVDYGRLTIPLIAEVQSLRARVKALEELLA